ASTLDQQAVTDADAPRHLGSLPVDLHLAVLDGLPAQRPRLEETRRPQPQIDAHAVGRSGVAHASVVVVLALEVDLDVVFVVIAGPLQDFLVVATPAGWRLDRAINDIAIEVALGTIARHRLAGVGHPFRIAAAGGEQTDGNKRQYKGEPGHGGHSGNLR